MFAGFDRDSYDAVGDQLISTIKANTNLRWIGFYLTHSHAAIGSTWTAGRVRSPQVSTWQFLRSEGWGLAPIYLGRQFVGGAVNPEWTEANGIIDGNHTANLAAAVGIETGATLYIDFEAGGVAQSPQALTYLRGWANTVLARGYRPGTYCSRMDVVGISAAVPNIVIWYYGITNHQPAVFDEVTQQLQLPHQSTWTNPAQGEWVAPGSTAWQFAWYNSQRDIHGVNFALGPGAGSHRFEPIDFDAARVVDPSHPEDGGVLCMSPYLPGAPVALAVQPGAALWTSFETGAWDDWGQAAARPASVGVRDLGYEPWFDTAGAAASRQPGHLDVFGVGIDGSVWTAWKNPLEEWVDHPWVLNPNQPARSGSPIAAVSRAADILDIFYINKKHEIVTQWWSPAAQNWQANIAPITHGFAMAPGTNLAAAVSPTDTQRLDVFGIDWSNIVRWAQWRNGGAWTEEAVPNMAAADPNLGVHATYHLGQLHLIVGGRDGSLNHLSHSGLNHGAPHLWSLAFSVPALGANVRPVAVRLVSIGDLLVAVGLAANGALFWSGWNGVMWTIPGFEFGAPGYSTQGRLAALALDNQTLDVMLVNQARKTIIRRLVRTADPLAPLVAANSWELIF